MSLHFTNHYFGFKLNNLEGNFRIKQPVNTGSFLLFAVVVALFLPCTYNGIFSSSTTVLALCVANPAKVKPPLFVKNRMSEI
jgi:hypothetical protein